MSVSRLVIAVVFLALGALTLRARARVALNQTPRPGRALGFLRLLGSFYLVLGLLWLALAFA